MQNIQRMNRREWFGLTTAAISLATVARPNVIWGAQKPRPRIAAILTEFSYRSHAHVILENFLETYYFNGVLIDPEMDVVSFYVDQFPDGRDMAREVSKKYEIPIYPTIAAALQCGSTNLAVDAVLSIGEHGKYPSNDRGQHMYPRKRFLTKLQRSFANPDSQSPFSMTNTCLIAGIGRAK